MAVVLQNMIKAHDSSPNKLVIKAGSANKQYWQDIWQYRELLYFLAWRDILVRYKQTIFGVTWALVRPFITMIVFTVVFGQLANLPSDGVPYPILVFTGLLPWQFFGGALQQCSNCLINDTNLISKVYFPRLMVPISTIVVNFVDFLVAGMILVGLMAWYDFVPSWRIFTLPLFMAIALAVTLGGGLWFAALNVKYRDFIYIVPFVVQFGLYVSPVGFSSNVVPAQWRLLYSLNPMVSVIDGFRWALLSKATVFYWPGFILSLLVVGLLLVSGIRYFRKTERTFADVI